MEFFTISGQSRPVKLTESTRLFAFESLNHKYGLDTRKTPDVSLDGIPDFEKLTPVGRYNAAIHEIVTKAPLRICGGELISGAATLGAAISHNVPASFDGKPVCQSVSHLTVDFGSVLEYGVGKLYDDVEKSMCADKSVRQTEFLESCKSCLDDFRLWHSRYLEALRGRPEFSDNFKNLLNVPFKPAESFYEAVQSLWFTFAFIRLCGNWPGIGRIDVLLGDYLKRDLASGKITLDRAREILAHFFIKGCEWVSGGNYGSGDAQHYQNIILSGIGIDGKDVTNEVTYLVLDIIDELGISDFPITVRVNRNTDEKLLARIANTIRYGGGIIAIYNEDLIIDALTGYGYELSEARQFANDGCWEVQIPGKTFFIYSPFDSLAVLQHKTLKDYHAGTVFTDFEQLYQAYIGDLARQVENIYRNTAARLDSAELAAGHYVWNPATPCTVVSLFEQGCIEKGYSYFEGGPVYNVLSPHIGGMADTVNSLYAIKKLVFDEHKLSFAEFMEVLRTNWEGNEPLRQYVLNRYRYYGNDNDEIDLLAARLLSDFSDICASFNGCCGYKFPSGVSTFGRQIGWAKQRLASAHGRKSGEVLAANCSPTPGTDRDGATAIIRSYCKADMRKQVIGAALDIKLLPSSVSGEDGLNALVALIRGFVALGGFFVQPDVADAQVLRDAQANPQNYQTLSVRVSGWNARFVTLSREWQDMVINEIEAQN